jgi:branched-chain amino acid transport system permease protein
MKRAVLNKHLSLAASLATILIFIVVRTIIPEYSQMVYFIVFYIALGLAFDIFLGFTNYVCFGYVVFLALGGYAMAHSFKWFTGDPTLSVALGLLLSTIYASIVALIVGLIGLRLREVYFAIATIGLTQGIRFFIEGFRVWGGSEGLIVAGDIISKYGSEWLTLLSVDYADALTFMTAIASIVITYYLIVSKTGYALLAIREDEEVAMSFGVNPVKYKLLVFMISAILGAFIGASKLLKDQAVFPAEAFSLAFTLEALVITLVGGKGTLLGPLIAGILYAGLKYFLTTIMPGLQLLVFALIVIGVVVLFPEGIVGWLKKRFRGTLLDELLI